MGVDEVQTRNDAEEDSGEAGEGSNASLCEDIEETTGTKKRAKSKLDLDELLKMMVEKNASDLHLTVPSPPILRIDGSLVPVPDMPPLDSADITKLFKQATITKQRTAFKKEKELDFAYSLEGVARFRVNALFQRGSISLAFRRVLVDIPSIEGLGLPAVLEGSHYEAEGADPGHRTGQQRQVHQHGGHDPASQRERQQECHHHRRPR